MASTLGDLIRRVGLELGLDRNNSSDEQLLMVDWANEGVRDVLIETKCVMRSSTIDLTAGQGDYMLSNAVLAIPDRQFVAASDGQMWKLQRVSVQEILDLRMSAAIADDTPRYYAAQGDTLMLYPAPSGDDSITIWTVPLPTEMSIDVHDPADPTYGDLPIYAITAVEDYMLWRGARYDEKRAPHTPKDYRDFYDQSLMRVRKRARGMGGRGMNGARIGYPGQSRVARRNDTYPER